MAIELSPSVTVVEKDLTNVIPAVSTSVGATIVDAAWGPVLDVTTVDSENELVSRFGKPNSTNATSWFTAGNFLAYSRNLLVVRTNTTNQRNAVSALTGTITSIPVTSGGTVYTGAVTVNIPAPSVTGGVQATATATVSGGVITAIVITNGGTGYSTVPVVTVSGTNTTPAVIGTVVTSQVAIKINNENDYINTYENGEGVVGSWAAKYPGTLGNSLKVSICDADGFSSWAYKDQFDSAPNTSTYVSDVGGSNDEVHVIVVDEDGRWTGTSGTVLEKYSFLSKASDARKEDGSSAYYKTVLNNSSKYVWWMDHSANVSADTGNLAFGAVASAASFVKLIASGAGTVTIGTGANTVVGIGTAFAATDVGKKIYNASGVLAGTIATVTTATAATLTANGAVAITGAAYKLSADETVSLVGGVDHFTSTDGQKMAAFDMFNNDEEFDVNLIPIGKANTTVANHVIQNIAEVRKDCVAFVSPEDVSTGEILIGTNSDITESILAYRNVVTSSSYGVIDSGYKYQYDKYNDTYRWVPLNGDIAGLCARTDFTNDPWFSPAGFNRGVLKNVVKLAFSPRKTDRDNLYKSGVNPVVSFPGQGTVLYGDKTALAKPSAFDRINVRRLFIVLEKAIATASKYQLFEFNDPFTRAQFVGMVTPFLRDVRGRRGITDFLVVCDETNNTGEVVDTNRFVGDIYIKPARSINFITLNFIATRTGVAFSEIAGKSGD
jgi:phage tail sheath protein FI